MFSYRQTRVACLIVFAGLFSGSAAAADRTPQPAPLLDDAAQCHFRHIDQSVASQIEIIQAIAALNKPGLLTGNARLEMIDSLVIAYQRLGLQQLALTFAATLTRAAPDNADYWSDQAISLARLNQTQQALDSLQHAFSLQDGDRHRLTLLGDLKLKLGDRQAAEAAYEKAFDQANDDAGRLYALLSLYPLWLRESSEQAARRLAQHRQRIDSQPWPEPILATMTQEQNEQSLAEQAVNATELADCSLHRTRLFESLYYNANAWLARGQTARAKQYYAAAAGLLPNGDNTELLLLDYRMQTLGLTEPPIPEQALPETTPAPSPSVEKHDA